MWVIALLPLLMILLGVGLLLGGSDERTRIASAQLVTCAQIPAGREVKLLGSAVAQTNLVAPLSKVPCVYYRLIFLQWQRKMYERSKELVEVHRMQEAADGFAIADHTGKIDIDPAGADLRLAKAHSGGTGILAENEIDALVARHLPGRGSEERTTVNELVIPAGAPLLALGEVTVTKGVTLFGGPRLLLSLLPEKELVKRDSGDAAGFALIAGGVLGLAGCVFLLLK